jgi:transposase
MERYTEAAERSKEIFVGVDLHRLQWHVTIRTEDAEVFSGSIPGKWEYLKTLLDRYRNYRQQVVYEAGYFGFWLHDHIIEYGAACVVTPPSLVPMEYGNHVKTDRRDSRKLAYLLAKGMLKRVWVPSKEERYERQVIRRRRQMIGNRVRTQNRIKAELRLYGIELGMPEGRWSKVFVENLHRLQFNNRWMQESFQQLLEEYQFLTGQIDRQTKLLRELAETPRYRERMSILRSVPGIGLIAAMELLLELQDVERFRRADQLAAYVGLTPSQYSSAEHIRMGRITGIGKNSLRGTLVEVAWRLIGKDPAMREKYERIKVRAGSKRAIIAIARMTLVRTRRILLDRQPYTVGLAA